MEQQPQISKLFATFTDDEATSFRQALAAVIGEDEASKLSWQRRGALATDGGWLIGVNESAVASLHNEFGDASTRPWAFPTNFRGGPLSASITDRTPGLMTRTKFLSIPAAVALLASERNPEIEVLRRKKLFDEALGAEQDRVTANAKAEAEAKQAAIEHAARRPERWAELPRLERCLFVAAAQSPRTPAQALLDVARLLSGGDHQLAEPPAAFEPEARL
jgi:hypothetical protein